MAPIDFSLYLVTDRQQTRGRSLSEIIGAALRAGVRAVQLREKDLATRPLLALARELSGLAAASGARLLINGRADVCVAAGGSGLQIPAAGLPVSAARAVLGAGGLIGVSTHSTEEAVKAEKDGADFIVLGPIFETPSKRAFGAPLGLRELERAKIRCRIPLFGIGGITKHNARDVMKAGAHGIAVVGSIMTAQDVERASAELLCALEG